MKLSNLLFRNRIKPIVVIQLILVIPMFIIGIYVFKVKEGVNFFYLGVSQVILAGFWFLMGIENFILKKRVFSLVSFILTAFLILLSLKIFHTLDIKQ